MKSFPDERARNRRLGRCVWNAMQAGVLDGFCAVFTSKLEAGRAIWQELVRIISVPRRDAGCAAARILWLTETPPPAD